MDAPKKISSLLFVCMGNICRSPAAENVMNGLLKAEGLENEVRCDSAGTIDFHQGKRPDRRMRRVFREKGVSMTGTSRLITEKDLKTFDLILAMDRCNVEDIRQLDPKKKFQSKILMMSVFAKNPNLPIEVPDPYKGKEKDFEFAFNMIVNCCEGLLDEIKRRNGLPRAS
ncbi:MAG: low molecular weight protein-tyrosine-phosphatase [Verrucomicrobiota bacterium]